MAGDVDLCNMALSHIGAAALVSSIDPPDGSAEAGYCAQFYGIARAEALESDQWTFSKKRAALAATTNPSSVWAYAYAIPSDCLKPLRVLQLQYVNTLILGWPWQQVITADELTAWEEKASADFQVEGQVLLTNEPEAVLLYVRDITDTTKFTPSFKAFFSYLLASYLAGPIVRGKEGAQTAGQLRAIAARVRGEAASQAANSGSSDTTLDYVPTHLRAR